MEMGFLYQSKWIWLPYQVSHCFATNSNKIFHMQDIVKTLFLSIFHCQSYQIWCLLLIRQIVNAARVVLQRAMLYIKSFELFGTQLRKWHIYVEVISD
jgi:hypothetical protein